jgi:hypothetical protein
VDIHHPTYRHRGHEFEDWRREREQRAGRKPRVITRRDVALAAVGVVVLVLVTLLRR